MAKLAPIPTPLSGRWREFRTRILPSLTFLGGITIVLLVWHHQARQATMQGIGESIRSHVNTPQTVRVLEWLVEPYTVIPAGTPVAVVAPAESRAEFDRLSSLVAMARMYSQASLAQDNAMNFERIRVELLNTKAELAIAQVKLQQAERDVARNTPLYREKLLAEELYELSVNTRDALQAEVTERSKAAAQIAARLELLRPLGEPELAAPTEADRFLAQLEAAHAAALKSLEPFTLVAPISGMVSLPLRLIGEFVPAGEPLLSIDSVRAENIVAYLRQPYRFDPEVGMIVRVTTRTFHRQVFLSHIQQVGAQVLVLTNAVAVFRPGNQVDAALPLIVPIPPDINIRPGEVVDVIVASSDDISDLPATKATPPAPRL
jgi:multidrug resistance efflux pump